MKKLLIVVCMLSCSLCAMQKGLTFPLKHVQKLALSDQDFMVFQDHSNGSNIDSAQVRCGNVQAHNMVGKYCVQKDTGAYLGHFSNGKVELIMLDGKSFIRDVGQDTFQQIKADDSIRMLSPQQRQLMKAMVVAAQQIKHPKAQWLNAALTSRVVYVEHGDDNPFCYLEGVDDAALLNTQSWFDSTVQSIKNWWKGMQGESLVVRRDTEITIDGKTGPFFNHIVVGTDAVLNASVYDYDAGAFKHLGSLKSLSSSASDLLFSSLESKNNVYCPFTRNPVLVLGINDPKTCDALEKQRLDRVYDEILKHALRGENIIVP